MMVKTFNTPLLLLVDDDPNDEELAKIALELSQVPHELVIKRDGAEALEWIQESVHQLQRWPNLILLDLKLPKITGLEVLEKLRSQTVTKNIPVVIFTSSIEEKDLIHSYEHGANAYIRKPVDFKEYQRTIGDMARFWMIHNQPVPRLIEGGTKSL